MTTVSARAVRPLSGFLEEQRTLRILVVSFAGVPVLQGVAHRGAPAWALDPGGDTNLTRV